MNIVLCLSFTFLFWLLGCAGIGTIKPLNSEFLEIWSPIISLLNEDPISRAGISDEVAADLLLQNQQELAQIKLLWSQVPGVGSSKVARNQENEFFHREIEKLNERALERLRESRLRHKNSGRNYGLIAQNVLKIIESNPIASSKNIYDYDEGDQIGYCFGRALFAHYLLLKAGIPNQDILKIFAVGNLRVEQQFWHFHVAVLVRDGKSGWIVVDSLLQEPQPFDEWIAHIHHHDIKYPNSRLRFYITDPRKFLPGSGIYDIQLLSQPLLQEYFYRLGLEMN